MARCPLAPRSPRIGRASNDGDYAVHAGAETAFLGPKKDKDLEIEQVLAVRELLTAAGYGPVVEALADKGEEV